MRQPTRIQPGERVPIRLSERERDLILEHTFIDSELARHIRIGPVEKTSTLVRLSLDDLDDLLGHVAAQANHCSNTRLRARLNNLWDRLRKVEDAFTDDDGVGLPSPPLTALGLKFTAKQGQYLAFLLYYTKLHGRAPSEAELRSYFEVSPPTVHRMLLALEERGFIERKPGKARAIRLLVEPSDVPALECTPERMA